MSDYRRWYVPGGTYFFTVVTEQRIPIFRDEVGRAFLGQAMRDVRRELPFSTLAIVVLHDHLHCLWNLPPGDKDFSTRWQRIKGCFTHLWCLQQSIEARVDSARSRRGERGVWQRRFWEHVIRDERDLESHFDYIHFNPVRHGMVARAGDWPFSSFRRYVHAGH